MKYLILMALLLSFKMANAATLSCELKINDQVMARNYVQTSLDQKTANI